MTVEEIQKVYDEAFRLGILEERLFATDPSVTAARIEDGMLIETVAGE